MACGHTFPTTSGRPLRPSQTTKNTSRTPLLRKSVSTPSRTSRPHPGAGPQTEDVLLPGQGDADRGVDGPVGDLPISDLDHHRVDEHRRADAVERPVAPVAHLPGHLAGDPADRLLAHRRAVALGEVRGDL